jgi:hypothetical protein
MKSRPASSRSAVHPLPTQVLAKDVPKPWSRRTGGSDTGGDPTWAGTLPRVPLD